MSKAHKHAEKMIFAAQHWHEAEWRHRASGKVWSDWHSFTNVPPAWDADHEYEVRLIRKTVTQPRREVPAPETEAPESGATYWIVNMLDTNSKALKWADTVREIEWLAAGLVYLDKWARDERVRAMLTLERSDG